MAETRIGAYTSGRFVLELDGKNPVGFVTSVDGGHFKAEAVKSQVGEHFVTTQYPGKGKYEDITIQVGSAMSPAFWKWVEASLNRKPERRTGAIVGYDFNSKERTRRTFTNALISEVQFPALDGASKNPATITVKIAPEGLEFKDGDKSDLKVDYDPKKQKRWLSSNFKFRLDKFGNADEFRSAKIEAFAVKQQIINNPVGSELVPRKELGRLEMPNLQVSFPERFAKDWMDWYDQTVIKGKHEVTHGYISYLPPDMNEQKELMRIEFDGVTLLSVDYDKYEAGRDQISKLKVTLAIEALTVKPGKSDATVA